MIPIQVGAHLAAISFGLRLNEQYGNSSWNTSLKNCFAPFSPDIANEFYDHLAAGRLEQAQQVIYDYEEPVMKIAGSVNWLSLMKTAIMMLGFYPNNRVGNPSRTCIEGQELERAKQFFKDVFQL